MKSFAETAVGKFYHEKIKPILKDLPETGLQIALDPTPTGILKAVAGLFGGEQDVAAADNLAGINELKMQWEKQKQDFEIEVLKLQFSDLSNARQREIEVAKTDSNWLVKSITPLLAVGTLLLAFLLFYLLIFTSEIEQGKREIAFAVAGIVGGWGGNVLTYYFGSSIGSHQKDADLRSLRK